jgi:hypothetical protein
VRDEPQNRPPWLRNLRTKHEVEQARLESAPSGHAPDIGIGGAETSAETAPQARSFQRRDALLLIVLLWMNISVLGCLCLLATQRVVP